MKLTSKARYAVTAMLDVALMEKIQPISLAEISERQCISLSYLEQLFSQLRKHGLVSSVRGPGGGYNLGKKRSDISIASIINAVDESIDIRKCEGKNNCSPELGACLTHSLWSELSDRIHSFLDDITLEELANSEHIKKIFDAQHSKFNDSILVTTEQ